MREYTVSVLLNDEQAALLDRIAALKSRATGEPQSPEEILGAAVQVCGRDITGALQAFEISFSCQLCANGIGKA